VFCRRGRERERSERERERERRDMHYVLLGGCGNTHPNSFQLVFHTSIKGFMHVKEKETNTDIQSREYLLSVLTY